MNGQDSFQPFKTALANASDVSDQWFVDFGGMPRKIEMLSEREEETRTRVRSFFRPGESVTGDGPRLWTIRSLAKRDLDKANKLLDQGCVAAVDGTDVMQPVSFQLSSAYACAVACLTRRSLHTPKYVLTETSTRYADPSQLHSDDELWRLCNELDAMRDEGAWSKAFREYQERRLAIDAGHPVTIIDGPIFTDNLATQADGRALLDELCSCKNRVFIGVIKELASSWAVSRFVGHALNKGEVAVIGPLRKRFYERFRDNRAVHPWVDNQMSKEFVRAVYCPGEKTFGFECRERDLHLAMAILEADRSPTLHHETPLLLELVDAKLRGLNESGAVRLAILSRAQRTNWHMGIDAIDERELR